MWECDSDVRTRGSVDETSRRGTPRVVVFHSCFLDVVGRCHWIVSPTSIVAPPRSSKDIFCVEISKDVSSSVLGCIVRPLTGAGVKALIVLDILPTEESMSSDIDLMRSGEEANEK